MSAGIEFGSANYNYNKANVLVTGGTSGIGAAIATAFLHAGATVTITGTKASKADYPNLSAGLSYQQCDVTDTSQVDNLAAQFKQLDILVHSAGVALAAKGLDEYQPDNFDLALQMHLSSVYRLSHGCLEALSNSKLPAGGCIIGIASMSSYFGMPFVPAYGAAKAGLVQTMKSMCVAWSDRGIRANAIAAGMTATRQTQVVVESSEMSAPILDRTPMKRFAKPEEIAGAALFLSSQQASYVNGQTINVCGGFSISG